MSRTWLGMPTRITVPLVITLAVMALLLLLGRTTVYSLTATITTDKVAAGNAAEYTLGEPVVFPIAVAFSADEQVPEEATIAVSGSIVGFSAITVPLTEGTHTLTSSLPVGYFLPSGTYNATTGNVKLVATVSFSNILDLSGYGYGYGYGYMGGPGGGTVNVSVKYHPPIMLYPQPAAAAGPLSNPTLKFSTFSGTPGAPAGDPNAPPDLPEMKFKNNIPPIPGSMPSADKLGFDVDGDTATMAILVDGFTGQADSIGFFSTGQFMQFKGNVQPGQALNQAGGDNGQLQGVVITKTSSGEVTQIAVVGGSSGGAPFFALINKNSGGLDSFDNSSQGYIDLGSEMTDACSGGGALEPHGVAYDQPNNMAYVVGLQQNDISCPTRLVAIDLSDGSVNGMDLDVGSVGLPCCYGLTYLEDVQELVGLAKDYEQSGGQNVFYQFGTGGSFSSLTYPYQPGQGGQEDINDSLSLAFDNDGDATNSDNYIYVVKKYGDIFFGIPGGATVIISGELSDMPIAISVDTNANVAYIVFDGNPVDGMKVVDLSAADPMASPLLEFNFDSEWVESAVFVPASIGGTDFIWNVDSGNCGNQKLEKRSTSDGTVVASYSLPQYVSCDIGGMDVDYETTNILIVEKYNDKIHSFDITTGNAISSLSIWDNDPNDTTWLPGGGESLAVESVNGNKRVLIGKQNKLFEVDIDTGGMMQGYMTPLMDITGMGGGTSGVLWMADKNQQKIYMASLPGAGTTETTTVGNYTATVDITPNPTNASTNWTTAFEIKKISSITLAVTSPADGSGVPAADLDSDGKINITGTIDDFTIKTVSFGATLGVTTLVGAPPTDPDGPFNLETSAETSAVSSSATNATTDWEISGLWNVVTATNAPGGNKYQGAAGLYYGQVSNWNYETGQQTSGNLDSPTFTVGAGSKLSFNTYYDTEPSFDWDQKTVQFCTSSNSCNTLLQLVDMMPPPQPPYFQMANPGFIFNPSTVGANWGEFADGRKFAFVPMTQSTNIEIPLSKTLGTGFLRFRFDTKDPFMNQLEGWYVDNIQVVGSGGATGVGFAVTDGAWSGKFKPSEGENKITVTASHTAYDATLNANGISASISLFLDTVVPNVVFDAITLPTKTISGVEVFVTGDSFLSGVISGTFTELVPDTLELFTLTNTSLDTLKTKDVFTDSATKNVLSKKTFDKTTLAVAVAAEANQIEVASATGLAVGSKITIGTTDEKETVTISLITGTDVDFYPKLENSHDADETVQEVTWSKDLNLGTTDTFIKVGLKLTDKGGLTDTETLVLSLDTTGPALTVNQVIYPIGATSARGEDELIFDVTAADALSGVDAVLFVDPSGPRTDADTAINDTTVTTDYNPYSVGDIVVVGTGAAAEARTITAIAVSQQTGMYTYTLDKKLKIIHVQGTVIAQGTELLDTTILPDVVVGKFGIVGTHVAFATVPAGTPAGQFAIQIAVSDTGGNTTVGNATGTITASLQGVNFYVMPGGNLLGMNLQPTYPNWTDILAQEVPAAKLNATFVSGITLASTTASAAVASGATGVVVTSVTGLSVNDGIKIGAGSAAESRRIASINAGTKTLTLNRAVSAAHAQGVAVAEFITVAHLTRSVFYFTGGTANTGSWQSYSPSVAADTLATAEQGKAYWLFLEDGAFKTSSPLPGFTTGTSIPFPIVVEGVLFDASAEPPSLPTTVPVVAGWNLIALVAEKDRTVEQGARGLMFPTQTFTSLAEYQKFVDFNSSSEEVTVVEGVFNPLFTGTGVKDMKVGRGFYVFMSEADTHTP